MIQRCIDIFNDNRVMAKTNFEFLHLGYFYSDLSRRKDISNECKDIIILADDDKYVLRKGFMLNSLKNMYYKYHHSSANDFFTYLIYINAIRGITNAIVEVLQEEDVNELFIKYIFKHDNESYRNFHEVLKFIRNIFSHNTRDELRLNKDNYEAQMNRLINDQKESIIVHFRYDCLEFPIPIDMENNIIDIFIDFNRIYEGDLYKDVIKDSETMSFIKFCYYCMEYLSEEIEIEDTAQTNLYIDISNYGRLGGIVTEYFSRKKEYKSLSLQGYIELIGKQKGFNSFEDFLNYFAKEKGFKSFRHYITPFLKSKKCESFKECLRHYVDEERDGHHYKKLFHIPGKMEAERKIQDIWDEMIADKYEEMNYLVANTIAMIETYAEQIAYDKITDQGIIELLKSSIIFIEDMIEHKEEKMYLDNRSLKYQEKYKELKDRYPIIKKLADNKNDDIVKK